MKVETMTDKPETVEKAVGATGAATKKAAYAVMGAPVVAGKRIGELSGKWRHDARREFEKWVTEGERVTADLRHGKVVEDIKEKVDFDNLQGRVEKLRDQLEDVLALAGDLQAGQGRQGRFDRRCDGGQEGCRQEGHRYCEDGNGR